MPERKFLFTCLNKKLQISLLKDPIHLLFQLMVDLFKALILFFLIYASCRTQMFQLQNLVEGDKLHGRKEKKYDQFQNFKHNVGVRPVK